MAKFAVLWHAAAFSLAIGRALDPQMAQSPRLRAARAYPHPATAVRAKKAALSSSSVNKTGARYTMILVLLFFLFASTTFDTQQSALDLGLIRGDSCQLVKRAKSF